MPEPMRILIVDDELIARENLSRVLEREGYTVTSAASGEEALGMLESSAPDLVLTDLKMPGMGGIDLLTEIKRLRPPTEIIMVTAYATVDSAIAAMKRGAYDYLSKPFKLDEVRAVVAKAAEKIALARENETLREQLKEIYRFSDIIGKSEKMAQVFDMIQRVAPTDANVLIYGETGTGKELVARAVHMNSPRAGKRFVSINCGAYTEELLSSELFGHERGAFTGAATAKTGLLEAGDGGTVFLDEIGEMSTPMQVRFLRVLQEGEVVRVGGTEPIRLALRVIAATHRDLKKMVAAGTFREDLFYRLDVVSIILPPLSDRKEDIPILAAHFLEKYNAAFGKRIHAIEPEAIGILMAYDFPGNIRELQNIIERAVVLCAGDTISARDLPADLVRLDIETHRGLSPYKTLAEQEKAAIEEVLRHVHYNRVRAAEILGVERTSLWRKIKRLGIQIPPPDAP